MKTIEELVCEGVVENFSARIELENVVNNALGEQMCCSFYWVCSGIVNYGGETVKGTIKLSVHGQDFQTALKRFISAITNKVQLSAPITITKGEA